MKLALTAALLFFSVTAHAETFGYANQAKVFVKSTEYQREGRKLQQGQNARQAELSRANDEIKRLRGAKAKPDAISAAQSSGEDLQTRLQTEDDAATKTFEGTMRDHLAKVCDRLAAERHLVAILPWVPLTSTKVDLTDEVIKRWNATDAEALAADNEKLKAELDAAKASTKAAPAEVPKK